MSFFKHHVFFCCNQRGEGETCCNQHGATEMLNYAKDKAKAMGIQGVRLNKAGCLGRCDQGPVMVVYPEAVWYTYIDHSDIDEILEAHLQNGQVVERLSV